MIFNISRSRVQLWIWISRRQPAHTSTHFGGIRRRNKRKLWSQKEALRQFDLLMCTVLKLFKKDRLYFQQVDSEAEVSSDVSAPNVQTTPHVYKRYSDENLCAAIKAVVQDGVRQFDACNKYGIPFTTLTRKLRLYKACGGRLPLMLSKRKGRSPENVFFKKIWRNVSFI